MTQRMRRDRPLSEPAIVQNPALGAFALWKFGLSYQAREGTRPVLPLAFLVLPLVFHKVTRDLIGGTHKASGLALFASKLGERREDLIALHERAWFLRELTLESVAVGVSARLLTIDYDEARLRANSPDEGSKLPSLPERIKWVTPAVEKLGQWFAAVPDQQIARTLKIDF